MTEARPTDAMIEAGLAEILAKDDTAIMLDELRELFGADMDVDCRFTMAQMLTAMEQSFKRGKEHIEMLNRAMEASRPPLSDDKLSWLVEERDALQAALAATHNERAALQQQLRVMREAAQEAKQRIGFGHGDHPNAAIRESNVNQAWHILGKALSTTEGSDR